MLNKTGKKSKSVLSSIDWHIKQGYVPKEIDRSDPKISMLVMLNEKRAMLYPDTVFICFEPIAFFLIKDHLKKHGFDLLMLESN